MITLLVIISIIVLWATLSTLVYKIMCESLECGPWDDPWDDPCLCLATIFSPIGILILLGYVIGLLLVKKLNYFIVCITKKLKDGEE